jgi:hypothetical protein
MSTPEDGIGETFASPPPRSSRHRYSLIISTNAQSDPGVKQRSGVDDRASASSVFRTAIIWREPSLTSTIRCASPRCRLRRTTRTTCPDSA